MPINASSLSFSYVIDAHVLINFLEEYGNFYRYSFSPSEVLQDYYLFILALVLVLKGIV